MKLRVLPRALRDLATIRDDISADDSNAAARVALAIVQTFEMLARNPGIGRPTERESVREWTAPGLPYLIPYRINGDFIEILRVFPPRRRRPPDWG